MTAGTTAIKGQWILTWQDDMPSVVSDRWVVVEGDTFAAVSSDPPAGADLIELDQALVMPGLINAHNHTVSSVMFRGLTEDWPSEAFGTDLIYGLLMPLGDLALEVLSAEQLQAVIELALLELLKGGTTTLVESFRPRQAGTFEAARAMGLRFYGAPYLFSTGKLDVGPDGRPAYAERAGERSDLDRAAEYLERYDGLDNGRIKVALAPHGADTCEPDLLREVRRMADEHQTFINIHLAQTQAEVELLRERYSMTPAEYLEHTGMLGPDVIVAHCINVPDEDLEILRRTDTTVANCPMTFARGGVYAPFARFAGNGIRTVVGTDGYYMDLVTELRMAGIISKLYTGRSEAADATTLLRAATVDGARALGRDDIGRIVPGARADLVAVSLAKAHFQPVSDPLKTFLWNARGGDADLLMVDGETLIVDGRFQRRDEAAIVSAGAEAVHALWRAARDAGIPHVPTT